MDPLCEKGEHRPRNEMKDCGGPVVYCPGCQATLVWADGKWHPAGKGMELLKNNEAKAIAAEKLRKAQQPAASPQPSSCSKQVGFPPVAAWAD